MTYKFNERELAAIENLKNPKWRLNNLYWIVNKQGQKVKFQLNWAQEYLYSNVWYCNVILKARQLGISTLICMLFLDRCLFNDNLSAGIIAHTLEDAQQIFRRVKFAYDNLPTQLREIKTAENDTTNMLKFANGSSLRVGTSLRSSTFQYLHISEFGKICAKYPDKAQEIITGSLNTVEAGQYIFIESTAEGRDGYFYDICKRAEQQQKNKDKLSKLDFKFFFFPWYKEPSYRIGNSFPITNEMRAYIEHLQSIGVQLDDEQIAWYIAKQNIQKDDMRREYPSTPEESWEVSNEGLYYCRQMNEARAAKRIGKVPYDDMLPVHTAWDLGYNDAMSIWFVQIHKLEIRLIEYLEGSGESLQHWIQVCKSKPYSYGKWIAPHDIMVHELSSGQTRQQTARGFGVSFFPSKKVEIIPGIDACRNMFARCWFDEVKCATGLKALDNYKKEWDERHSCWVSKPLHNWASHGADAFRTLATGLHYLSDAPTISGHNPAQWMSTKYQVGR